MANDRCDTRHSFLAPAATQQATADLGDDLDLGEAFDYLVILTVGGCLLLTVVLVTLIVGDLCR